MKEEQIFHQVLEQPVDQREAFLSAACGADLDLRERVSVLLRAQANPGSFLQAPAVGVSLTIDQIWERPGTLIGPYKLLEQIGEGGMGVVYVAEQMEPVRRRVALKIIKPGMDTRQVIARFEAERQALAMMEHPNIAKVLDAGVSSRHTPCAEAENGTRSVPTTEGRPYFVMELVRGLPITEYCDKARLSPRQRLALLVDVCHAVQHAHQKGVIHRDLKPSNVMITVHDGRPMPKVIDFGVAKAVGQQLTERTVYTAHTQLVGTPLYMSPEQADLSSQDVDTRSDVYSLGVLLYELLTGQTPFDKETLHKAGFDEMRRIIREDEPLRPSHRVSTLGAQASSTISQQRSLDERRLSQVLRGELDWIVMKALEKDRSRRYESASSLAADIQRFLSDEPVLACPPTTMYRFQKFARKHKPALVTAAAIALCLLVGTTVSAWQAVRATTAEAQATVNAKQAQASAVEAKEKAAEATQQRDEAKKQRDEVKSINDKLLATQAELRSTLYAARIHLAQQAWDLGGVDRVRELLALAVPKSDEPDLRGFEWHYLNRLCNRELRTLQPPTAPIACLAYSPDGKRIAIGNTIKIIKLVDAETGRELLKLTGHSAAVHTLAFSPDGKRLASASAQPTEQGKLLGEIKLWDTQTGEEIFSLDGGTRGMAFSPDGTLVAGASGDWNRAGESARGLSLKVWDAQTGKELHDLKEQRVVTSMCFSRDSKRLAYATRLSGRPAGSIPPPQSSAQLKIWDVAKGEEQIAWNTPYPALSLSYFSLGRLGPGRLLRGVLQGGAVVVWDPQTGTQLSSVEVAGGSIAVFSPDGEYLAFAGGDNGARLWSLQAGSDNARLWSLHAGSELDAFKGHSSRVSSVAFSPDGKHLATASAETIKIWDIEASRKLVLRGHTDYLNRVTFSPDGKLLASASDDMTVKVWDRQAGEELFALKEHTQGAKSVAISPDGKTVASVSRGETLRLWDSQSGEQLKSFKGTAKEAWSVVFSPDGKQIACPLDDKSVRIWDVKTGEERPALKNNCIVWYLSYSPDGKRLAGATEDKLVKVWDTQTGEVVLTLKGHTADLEQVAFSPDGKRLASACDDKTVRIWNAETGDQLLSFGHVGGVWDVAFSADGKRLASVTDKGEVKLWDALSGQELLTLVGPAPRGCVAFSPDGHWLASGSGDNSVVLYDATPVAEKR